VAADDGPVLSTREDRRDEAVLLERAGERFELSVGDAPRIGRVRPQELNGYLLDLEFSY